MIGKVSIEGGVPASRYMHLQAYELIRENIEKLEYLPAGKHTFGVSESKAYELTVFGDSGNGLLIARGLGIYSKEAAGERQTTKRFIDYTCPPVPLYCETSEGKIIYGVLIHHQTLALLNL